jgi:hypothetical protein
MTPGKDSMRGAYLGPEYTESEIESYLRSVRVTYRRLERQELLQTVARLLAEEKVVGWFNGRMEFGPRALGSRSILGDPRSARMQAQMNIKIKFREGFRPFAPSVLRERVNEYFELDVDSPYMLLVAPVRKERQIPMDEAADRLWGIDKLNVVRSDIPAVTHIDYSARIQTVSRETNPDYYDLIREFECLTGCAVLVNTSFNVRGEPIVCSPADAYRCFMRTHSPSGRRARIGKRNFSSTDSGRRAQVRPSGRRGLSPARSAPLVAHPCHRGVGRPGVGERADRGGARGARAARAGLPRLDGARNGDLESDDPGAHGGDLLPRNHAGRPPRPAVRAPAALAAARRRDPLAEPLG